MNLTPDEQKKQEAYRDSRFTKQYDGIWQSVGKCVFCDLRDKYIFYEENDVVMTVNLHAYIDGNLMIVPRRHVKSAKELADEEWQTMRKMMYIAKKLVRKVHGIKGMQYIMRDGGIEAQSTVSDHLHLHVIPFDAPDLSSWNYRKLRYTPLENAELFREQQTKIKELAKRFVDKYAKPQFTDGDRKGTYREAFQQMLANKKASQAKKTAKVGVAVIAGDKIVSTCNANVGGGPMDRELDGKWTSPPTVSHGEERCIALAAKEGVPLAGATMIVNISPCMMCSRLIINSGIKELHYIDDWWDKNALDFLVENGVKVIKIPLKKEGR
jgi:diadenosine tetraphosphate (Ap4A) HIT family hydrolase/deoxycytidylate deaminase